MSESSGSSGGPFAQWTDEEIVNRLQVCARTDQSMEAGKAFEELYRRHANRILNLILFLLSSPWSREVAEDLTETTFMNVFETLIVKQAPVSFTKPGSVKAWLNRIAVNEANRHWRDSKRSARLNTPTEEGREESPIEEAASIAAEPFTEDVERRMAIEEAKSKLFPRDRKIIELAFEEDRDITEVAELLGIEDIDTARQVRWRAALRFRALYSGPLPWLQKPQDDSPRVSPKLRNTRRHPRKPE